MYFRLVDWCHFLLDQSCYNDLVSICGCLLLSYLPGDRRSIHSECVMRRMHPVDLRGLFVIYLAWRLLQDRHAMLPFGMQGSYGASVIDTNNLVDVIDCSLAALSQASTSSCSLLHHRTASDALPKESSESILNVASCQMSIVSKFVNESGWHMIRCEYCRRDTLLEYQSTGAHSQWISNHQRNDPMPNNHVDYCTIGPYASMILTELTMEWGCSPQLTLRKSYSFVSGTNKYIHCYLCGYSVVQNFGISKSILR
jgi:hypothetical protein